MKPIHNPDEVLWRLLEIKRQLYALRAQTHVARTGYAWKPKCRLCSHKHRVPTLDGGYQCESCDAPWELEKVAVPKAPHNARGRWHDPRTDLISRADVLSRILDLEPWDRRVYVELFCYERRSFKGTAAEARRRWPRNASLHSDKRVRTRIERCRTIISQRLERRGMANGG